MGADLCTDGFLNSNDNFNNKNNIMKNNSIIDKANSPTIKENVSVYSNSDLGISGNNKYFNNETDINNLRSSIFDNEEYDHVKRYEQEINTYEHPYLCNQNNNINTEENNNDINENNYNNNELSMSNHDKEYTFKNSPSGGNFPSSINSNKRILDYNRSNELISSNKNSFKKFENLRNKKNQKKEEICSFGNLNNYNNGQKYESNNKNDDRNSNKSNNSDVDNIESENQNQNELIINKFINKNEAKKHINNYDPKVMNKFAINQLIKIQKKIRKSIRENTLKANYFNKDKIDEFLPSLNIINSTKDKTITNKQKYFCVRYYNNGCIYIGQMKNNKCNGYGKYKTQDNDLILAFFNNNNIQDYGIIERKNTNSIYEGEFNNNAFNGIAIESFKDGAAYYGQFKNNKKHGIGTYIWSDNTQYQGEWRDGEMNGYGLYFDGKSRSYEGQWKEGKMDGVGLFRWGDGRKYIGFFKEDKRQGFGIYMWKNPLKIYNGFWKGGEQSGYGKVYTPFKEKAYLWNKGKINKNYHNNDIFLQEIMKGNNPSITSKIKFFKMSFDDLLSFMLDI